MPRCSRVPAALGVVLAAGLPTARAGGNPAACLAEARRRWSFVAADPVVRLRRRRSSGCSARYVTAVRALAEQTRWWLGANPSIARQRPRGAARSPSSAAAINRLADALSRAAAATSSSVRGKPARSSRRSATAWRRSCPSSPRACWCATPRAASCSTTSRRGRCSARGVGAPRGGAGRAWGARCSRCSTATRSRTRWRSSSTALDRRRRRRPRAS